MSDAVNAEKLRHVNKNKTMIISYRESLALFNLQPGYSEIELKTAYRKAAHKYHPDKGGDSEIFKRVTAAYDLLKNHEPQELNNRAVNINFYGNGYATGFTITYRF